MKRYLLAALLLAAGTAFAQIPPVVTLTANPTSCQASGCAPALTWSTTPAAASCTASGGWTGTKAASGTQTLPAITTPKTYTLTCVGQVSGTATLTWAPPTTNTNGTPLTNLAGYTIVWGASASTMAATVAVNDPAATTAQVTGIPSGTWFFAMVSVNSAGVQSDQSNVVTKTVPAGATGTASVTVDVSSKPNPPVLSTVSIAAFVPVFNKKWDYWAMADQVGTVRIGAECNPDVSYGNGFYALKDPKRDVTYYAGRRAPKTVAVECG